MTLHTWNMAYIARAATDLSHVTDRLTDTVNIGHNSQHLMPSMQPNNGTWILILSQQLLMCP